MAILDETANNNDGSYNGVLYQKGGRIGYSLGFDGSTWVAIPDNAVFDSSQLTIAFWYKTDAWSGSGNGYARFIDRTQGGAGDTYSINRLGSDHGTKPLYMRFALKIGASTVLIYSNEVIEELSVWHHVVCTWDGTTMKMYLDGILQDDTKSNAGGPISSTNDINLGRSGDGSEYFEGRLDEVMIWSKALTAAEVATYNDWNYVY